MNIYKYNVTDSINFANVCNTLSFVAVWINVGL